MARFNPVYIILIVLAGYLAVQGVRCRSAVRKEKIRLASYKTRSASLSFGKMTYVDEGSGEVILSVHGIFGGYDQAFDTCRDFIPGCRILAPSRFGYPGSDVAGSGTPADQAAAFRELLDSLNIDKVFLLATSAGGSVALRFALDYPERTKGLILYCSAMPPSEKPLKLPGYAGPPPFLCSDYAMFLLSPFFRPIMGMNSATVFSMLPVRDRKAGVVLDASATNIDMARNFDTYKPENLTMPVLILHAKDDRLANYSDTEKALPRFQNCTFLSFETGGHLMTGHEEEVRNAVTSFIKRCGQGTIPPLKNE